jgi:ComEC/Rec2-related protein
MTAAGNSIQSIVSTIRLEIKTLSDKYPALVLLCGLVNGLLPMTAMPDKPVSEKLLYCVPALLLIFLLPKAKAWIFAILTLTGIAAVGIYLWMLDDNFLAITGERDCGAETIIRISDASCGGATVPWMQNPPLLRADILQIRLNGEKEWRKTSGRTAIFLPKNHGPVNYGEVLRLHGVFRKADSTILEEEITVFSEKSGRTSAKQPLHKSIPGNFDFQRYLLSRGIVRTFHASEAVSLRGYEQFSFLGKLLDFRNMLVASSAEGIEKTESKSMLAILLFGYRQGLGDETRNSFVRSGTIHIFSVSGLNVAILAAMVLWLLRPFPFRIRYLTIPPLMLAYVAATGMQAPAVRSLLMISLWAVCRAFLYYTPNLNVVFLAAVIILGINPFYISDIGVQYSFIIVIFLLASGESVIEWAGSAGEKNRWIPPGRRSAFEMLRLRKLAALCATLASCVIAWMVSSGISLYYQGIYFPLSIIANFIIIPFVSVLYLLVFVKFLVIPLSFMVSPAGKIIELVLDSMTGVCTFFYNYFENTAMIKPPLWSLLIFYTALLLLITSRRKKILLPALAAVFSILILWHAAPRFLDPEIVVMSGGGSQTPAVVICPPGGGRATVINVPSWESAQAIVNTLRVRGVTRIDRLILTNSRKDACAGAAFLLSAIDVNQIIPERTVAKTAFLASLLKTCPAERTAVRWPGAGNWYSSNSEMNLVLKNNDWAFEYTPGDFNINLQITETLPGASMVKIKVEGYSEISAPIQNSSALEARKYVFK